MDKKKYSWKEKRAYYIGYGAALGGCRIDMIKKVQSKMSPGEKKSFNNGLDNYFSKKEKRRGRK